MAVPRRSHLSVTEELLRAKPSAAKGKYVKSLTISTTMGPGIPVDAGRLKDTEGAAVPA